MSEPTDGTVALGTALADFEDDWDENDEGEGEYEEDDEGDDDIDAEAEEMARKLNEQIWADMQNAIGAEGTSLETNSASTASVPSTAHAPPAPPASSRKEEAVMVTIKVIMALLNHDSVAQNTLGSTAVPNTAFSSVFDALQQILASGKVAKVAAFPLSQTLISLAGSEALFGSLRGREAALGKRKREEEPVTIPPAPKPPSIYDLVSNAVQVVSHALHTSSSINPALITSIQLPLHHIFLFCRSLGSKPNPTPPPTMSALQEISGLIQVLGVLSGIQIGVNTTHGPTAATDLSTTVNPCMVPSCAKIFHYSTSLRNHERHHHPHIQLNPSGSGTSSERPCKCVYPNCSASFLRNSDLKRHVKVTHERKSFQCGGCGKRFSRRDAIKRHRDNSEAKAQKRPALLAGPPCFESMIIELEAEGTDHAPITGSDGAMPDPKRIKTEGAEGEGGDEEDDEEEEEEEGEISESMISSTQTVVLQLHAPLRAVVAKASGASLPLITGTTDSLASTSNAPSNPVSTTNETPNLASTSTSTPNVVSETPLVPQQGMQVRHIIDHSPSINVTPASTTTHPTTTTPTTSTMTSTPSTNQVPTRSTGSSLPFLILHPPSFAQSQASRQSVVATTKPQTTTGTSHGPAVPPSSVSNHSGATSGAPSFLTLAPPGYTSNTITNKHPLLSSGPVIPPLPSSVPSTSQPKQTSPDHQSRMVAEEITNATLSEQTSAGTSLGQQEKGTGSENVGLNGSSSGSKGNQRGETATGVGGVEGDKQLNAENGGSDADADGEADMDMDDGDMEIVASAV